MTISSHLPVCTYVCLYGTYFTWIVCHICFSSSVDKNNNNDDDDADDDDKGVSRLKLLLFQLKTTLFCFLWGFFCEMTTNPSVPFGYGCWERASCFIFSPSVQLHSFRRNVVPFSYYSVCNKMYFKFLLLSFFFFRISLNNENILLKMENKKIALRIFLD